MHIWIIWKCNDKQPLFHLGLRTCTVALSMECDHTKWMNVCSNWFVVICIALWLTPNQPLHNHIPALTVTNMKLILGNKYALTLGGKTLTADCLNWLLSHQYNPDVSMPPEEDSNLQNPFINSLVYFLLCILTFLPFKSSQPPKALPSRILKIGLLLLFSTLCHLIWSCPKA